MRVKSRFFLFGLFVLLALVPGISNAADVVVENEIISVNRNIDSNEGILLKNVTIESSGTAVTNVVATGNYHLSINSSITPVSRTIIKKGATFKVIMRDNDGLSNRCEMQYFKNLNQGPNGDADGDKLTNYYECALGTDPTINNPDNDNDGLPDWWEVQYSGADLNGLSGKDQDADGDGISNWVEFQIGTNPMDAGGKGPGLHYEYDALGRLIKIWRIPQK